MFVNLIDSVAQLNGVDPPTLLVCVFECRTSHYYLLTPAATARTIAMRDLVLANFSGLIDSE